MIDNIEIYFDENALGGWKPNANMKTTARGARWFGSIRNMKFEPRLHGGEVVEMRVCGSLAKFYRGENFSALTCPEIRDALEVLAAVSGLNIGAGVLCSVEIGCSIPLRGAVSSYLSLFGNAGGLYRRSNIYNQTGTLETVLYFLRSGLNDFKLYDKTAEAKAGGGDIPEIWRGDVLRAEYRLRKRAAIKTRFKRDLSPLDLNDAAVFGELKRLFFEFYANIQKRGRLSYIDTTEAKTPKDVDTLAFSYFVQNAPDDLARVIEALKRNSDENTVKRLRKKVRDVSTGAACSIVSANISELDAFIAQKCGM